MQINTNPRAKQRIKLSVAEIATLRKASQILDDLAIMVTEEDTDIAAAASGRMREFLGESGLFSAGGVA